MQRIFLILSYVNGLRIWRGAGIGFRWQRFRYQPLSDARTIEPGKGAAAKQPTEKSCPFLQRIYRGRRENAGIGLAQLPDCRGGFFGGIRKKGLTEALLR